MEAIVQLTTIILLGLILATLICMMLVLLGVLVNIQKNSESMDARLSDIQENINKLANRMVEIIDTTTYISNLSIDMKYHQKMLREQEMSSVIEKLKGIKSYLNDLKIHFFNNKQENA